MNNEARNSKAVVAESECTERPSQNRCFPEQTRLEVMNQQKQDIVNFAQNHCQRRYSDSDATPTEIDLMTKLHERIGAAIAAMQDGRE